MRNKSFLNKVDVLISLYTLIVYQSQLFDRKEVTI